MTDDPKQKPQKAAPATDKKGKVQKPKIKRVWRLGVISYILIFFIILIVCTLTPVYAILLSYVPERYRESIYADFYRSIVLSEDEKQLSEPFKYEKHEFFPVLGIDTGVCFSFNSTIEEPDNSRISAERLDNAARGKKIANIIAVGKDKYEYKLEITSMNEIVNEDGSRVSTVCQKFGTSYPSVPKTMDVIYIRPLKPFKPYKIIWASAKEIYFN